MTQREFLPGLRGEHSPAVDASEASEKGRQALRDGCYGDAAGWFERAVADNPPGDADDLLGLAEARLWEGRYAEVEPVCRGLIARDPACVDARGLLGLALAHLGRASEAVGLLVKAPDHPAVHVGRALALGQMGQFSEAELSARKALAEAPDYPAALRVMGEAMALQRRHGEALSVLGRALKVDPDDALARVARAHVQLSLGHDRAWGDLAWRFRVEGYAPAFPPVGPAWDGTEPLAGKTLLLVAEPWAGDQFLFVRYARALKLAGARVVLGVPAELAGVLAGAEGVDRVVTDPAALDEPVDFHAHLMSLPGLVPVAPPGAYLRPDPALAARWAADVAALPGSYKVAVCPGGDGGDDRRSIPDAAFARLAAVKGVQLIRVGDVGRPPEGRLPLIDFGARLDPGPAGYAETAAVLAAVDLVVTGDGPLAHLAGAMGVPTWVALPVGPDWRWQIVRNETPWYPGVQLFRQAAPGNWSGVFEAMEPMLRAGVACRSSALRSA